MDKKDDSLGKAPSYILEVVNNSDILQVRIKDRYVETLRKDGSIFTNSISKDGHWSFGTNACIEDFGKFSFTLPEEDINNEK